jgi:hypothetical protein
MATRRPNVRNAAFELGFVAAAFACGLVNAPVWVAAIVAFATLAYWSWSRRVALNRLRGANWALQSAIAVALIIAVVAGAYWLGLALTGGLS